MCTVPYYLHKQIIVPIFSTMRYSVGHAVGRCACLPVGRFVVAFCIARSRRARRTTANTAGSGTETNFSLPYFSLRLRHLLPHGLLRLLIILLKHKPYGTIGIFQGMIDLLFRHPAYFFYVLFLGGAFS